jgi:hypothetical protein
VRGDIVSYKWKIGAMVEWIVVKQDENKEANTARVETSKKGASLAPAIDLRSTYLMDRFRFPTVRTHPHSTHVPFPTTACSCSLSLSRPLACFRDNICRCGWFILEQHCHIFILDTEGDPPVLLGTVLFAECHFSPSNAFVKHSDRRLERMH